MLILKKNRIAVVWLFFCYCLSSSPAYSDSDMYLKSDEAVAGLLQSDYVNMWWQWTKSMPRNVSPVRDNTGVRCAVNQAGPVWFLAGGYGSSLIYRKCSIPSDKHIFFPIINIAIYSGNNRNLSCEEAKSMAAVNNKHLVSFNVVVDDKEFVNPVHFRQSSKECFDIAARIPGASDETARYPAATDGYWIMLKPLSVGKHKIAFHAEYNNPGSSHGNMVQHIAYELEIYDSEQ